jgi:hypothetical protein
MPLFLLVWKLWVDDWTGLDWCLVVVDRFSLQEPESLAVGAHHSVERILRAYDSKERKNTCPRETQLSCELLLLPPVRA